MEKNEGTRSVNVHEGEILRLEMLKRGISVHNGKSRLINCRGLGTCGTCAVEISSSSANIHPNIDPIKRNMKEELRLNLPPHGSKNQSPNLRLACQVQVRGDIVVTKRDGFWGQHGGDAGKLADMNEAQLYFGDLEYVMDNKSPSDINKGGNREHVQDVFNNNDSK